MYGLSTAYGKIEITNFLKERLNLGDRILDVGAGSGTWRWYLGTGYNLDAVEVFEECAIILKNSINMYNNVYIADIRDFEYPHDYELIIFGDIIEHLSVKDAQKVLAEASKHAKHIMIAVPYLMPQEAINGNEAEKHLQPDLTHQLFKERYPGYELIFGRFSYADGEYGYGYYYK